MDEGFDYSTDSGGEVDSASVDTSDTDTSWESDTSEIDLPEDIPEDIPETSEELEILDSDSDEFGELPEDIPEDLPEVGDELETLDFDSDEFGELPEDIPEDLPEVSDELEILDFDSDEFGELPEDIPEDLPEVSDELEILDFDSDEFGELPEDIPEDVPDESEELETLESILETNGETEGSLGDDDTYHAIPNSEILILQEDGTVDSLENTIAANAETEGTEAVRDSAADVSTIDEPDYEPIHMTQGDAEWFLEDVDDPERLRQLRDGIVSGQIQIDADAEAASDDAGDTSSGPILTRDPSEQWEIGNRAIDDTVEAMRDDLRDKGMEDGPEMEAIVMTERARMQEELARNINGDFSNPYQKPDFNELIQGGMTDVSAQDSSTDATDIVADVPPDIDYDAVYSGLDSYDFDGIDYGSDVERLDASLENFQSGTWENLSVDEQKAAMSDLADYVKDVIGFDNPPEIVYYNNSVGGDYGGYSPGTNTLEVNEYMLYDNNEAADTIAHELWHAYQHERAQNPQSTKDYQYQYGFENYIRPGDDFAAYQDQLVEAEARAFAQQFKDRLSTKRRSI